MYTALLQHITDLNTKIGVLNIYSSSNLRSVILFTTAYIYPQALRNNRLFSWQKKKQAVLGFTNINNYPCFLSSNDSTETIHLG
jgi:hypothetical protein